MSAMLALLPLLFVPLALAQSSGTLTLSTSSGCIILSQVASLSTPYSLTQSLPICPGSSASINWPLSASGNGAASNMVIYANINNGSPGCVMALSQMQAMYLLGRSLEWRSDGLWDNGEQGLIRDPTSFNVITCGTDGTYLPSGFTLPDPTSSPSSNDWTTSYTVEPDGGFKAPAPQPEPSPEPQPSPEPSSSPPPPHPTTSATKDVIAIQTSSSPVPDAITVTVEGNDNTVLVTSTVKGGTVTVVVTSSPSPTPSPSPPPVSSQSSSSSQRALGIQTFSSSTSLSGSSNGQSRSTRNAGEHTSSSDIQTQVTSSSSSSPKVIGFQTMSSSSRSSSTPSPSPSASSFRTSTSSKGVLEIQTSSSNEDILPFPSPSSSFSGTVSSSSQQITSSQTSSRDDLGSSTSIRSRRRSSSQMTEGSTREKDSHTVIPNPEPSSSSSSSTMSRSVVAFQTKSSSNRQETTFSPQPSPSPSRSPSPSPSPSPIPLFSPSPQPDLHTQPSPTVDPPHPTSSAETFVFTDGNTIIGQFTLPNPQPTSSKQDNPLNAPVFGPDGKLLIGLPQTTGVSIVHPEKNLGHDSGFMDKDAGDEYEGQSQAKSGKTGNDIVAHKGGSLGGSLAAQMGKEPKKCNFKGKAENNMAKREGDLASRTSYGRRFSRHRRSRARQ